MESTLLTMQTNPNPKPQIEVEAREDFRGPYLLVSSNLPGPCRAGNTEHLSCWFIQRNGKVQCFQCDTIETAQWMATQ